MGSELISKKELLELTGISYGQLYRWKRKQLIPEEWFIRKSTFTGQETFFPKGQILSRIGKIVAMKDELSLDELAGKLSPMLYDLQLRQDEFIERNIVSRVTVERLGPLVAEEHTDEGYSLEQMLFLYTADKLLQSGEMSFDEGEELLVMLQHHFAKFEGRSCDLIFARKTGVSLFMLTSASSELFLEHKVKVVARLSMTSCLEELKLKLS